MHLDSSAGSSYLGPLLQTSVQSWPSAHWREAIPEGSRVMEGHSGDMSVRVVAFPYGGFV